MTPTQTPFATMELAAKHFLVSPSTFRSWVRTGIVPKDTYIQLGSVFRFDLPAVTAALRARSEAAQMGKSGDEK